MVALLQLAENTDQVVVFGLVHVGLQGVELVECFFLQFVAQPGAGVALLICPGDRERNVERCHGLIALRSLGRRAEIQLARQDRGRYGIQEIEDAAGTALVLTEGLVVHEEVQHIVFLQGGEGPVGELVGRQRPTVPSFVRETEGDVVAQVEVAQQELQARVDGVHIDEVGALPTQNVLGALGQHHPIAHLGHGGADGVGVDELGVAEHGGLDAEQALGQVGVLFDLLLELRHRRERSERMGIGLSQEFHAAGVGERLETVDHLRGIAFELLDGDARDGEGHLEGAVVPQDEIVQQPVGRQIAAFRHPAHDGPVGEIVEIMVVVADVKEAELPQTVGLVDLEVETN